MSRLKRTIQLSCKHTVDFEAPVPKIGEIIYCRRCQTSRIVEQRTDTYYVKCTKAGCPYGRNYGSDAGEARLAAWRHVQKFHSHSVSILRNGESVNTVTFDDPLLPDMATHREHLRNFVTRTGYGLDNGPAA